MCPQQKLTLILASASHTSPLCTQPIFTHWGSVSFKGQDSMKQCWGAAPGTGLPRELGSRQQD